MVSLTVALVTFAASAPATAEKMNISQFVFRDLNRNGIYDRGEPPYAGIPIRLEQDGRDDIVRQSNLAGFANFPMSNDDSEQDITAEGPARFSIVLPEGLDLTTGNPAQSGSIFAMERAPGGFVLDPPNPFMGVAPSLTIETSTAGLRSMTCSQNGLSVAATASGTTLVCPVTSGDWNVIWERTDGTRQDRVVTVTDGPVHVPFATTGDGDGTGEPLRITFDDFLTSQNITELPSFDGFLFHNFVVAHRIFYGGWGYVNGTLSGEFSAYNSSGHPATIRSERPFELRSLSLGVAWPAGQQGTIVFTALRDGKVVAREAVSGSNLRPIRFEPRWSGIDTVIIGHSDYWQFVIDDLVLVRD